MIHSEGFYTKPSLKWGQLLLPGGVKIFLNVGLKYIEGVLYLIYFVTTHRVIN